MKTRTILTSALTACLAIGAVLLAAATTDTAQTAADTSGAIQPDFAFPDKVARDATRRLDKALDAGNGRMVVNSLVCYSLARNAVSPTLLPEALARIDSVRAVEPDSCVRSLLALLEAKVYAGLYARNRWEYDQRQIPVDSLSADPAEWSGQQYRMRIGSLLDDATAPRHALLASPLRDWAPIIEANEWTYTYYPTLFDMVADNAIKMLNSMVKHPSVLPARALDPDSLTRPLPAMANIDPQRRRIHELYLEILAAHSPDSPAYIHAMIGNIGQLNDMCVAPSEAADSAYMHLYRSTRDVQWSGEVLLELRDTDTPRYLALLDSAIARYPDFFMVNDLKNRRADITRPSVNMKCPANVSPGKPLAVNVTFYNTTEATIYLRRAYVPADENIKPQPVSGLRRKATAHNVKIEAGQMPFKADTTVNIPVGEPGRYYIWVEMKGKKTDTGEKINEMITCTDIAPVTVNYNNRAYLYAVSATDGRPLSAVSLLARENRGDTYSPIGTTDADGNLAKLTIKPRTDIIMSQGNDTAWCYTPWSQSVVPDKDWRYNATILTSLPLYHHGDTVQWALMARFECNLERELIKNQEIKVELRDANHDLINSKVVQTDATGRACGEFVLPSEGLSGEYTLSVANSNIAPTRFTVNDYKLPTFSVEADSLSRSASPAAAVTVTARAKAYSGFPISDARVKVSLSSVSGGWWRASYGTTYWSCDTVTDATGAVTLRLPQQLLDLSPESTGRYRITFEVTSPGGETQSCSRTFSTGKPYTINRSTLDARDIDISEPLTLGEKVYDANGDIVDLPLTYTISDTDGHTVATIARGDRLPKAFKPGVYNVTIATADASLASPETVKNLTMYRPEGACPVDKPLYVPVSSYTASGHADVLIGSACDDAYILMATTIDNRLVSRSWYRARKGMQRYRVEIPDTCHQVDIAMTSVRGHKAYASNAKITNSNVLKDLQITVESFRDKVVPGTPEKITLRVKENGTGTQAAVMMLMQSRAILDLRRQELTLGLTRPRWFTAGITTYCNSTTYFSASLPWQNPLKTTSIVWPGLQMYGMSFESSSSRAMRKFRSLGKSSADEVFFCGSEERAEPTSYMAMNESVAMAADNAGIAYDEEATADTGSPADDGADTFHYRPSEIPLAFFAPMLSTDADGSLTYTYTVPDANTEWTLRALAYTPSLDAAASMERTVTASRPIMVHATLPRFLRYGDKAVLRATAMNQGSVPAEITTTVTLINAADMSVVKTLTRTHTVGAGLSHTVEMPYTAPTGGVTALIYRVKSTSGIYSDGEQTLLPLLPASQPVVTSAPFYVPADSTSWSRQLPAPGGGDGVSTLYMYDNPLWEVATALPSLSTADAATSTAAMENIYMASIAREVAQSRSGLPEKLLSWIRENKSAGTLQSALQRNDDLKQLTLNATPWVREAMTDAQRLEALDMMLDTRYLDGVVNKNAKILTDLQGDDGGLAWCRGFDKSSPWATYRVLELAASLEERHCMPSRAGFRNILLSAVKYADALTARDLEHDKGTGDYTRYAYIRSILTDIKPNATSERAIKQTINHILRRWETEPVQAKATDAVILYHNGYKSMAARLIESIKAYAMTSAERGMWWHGIDAHGAAMILRAVETVTPADTAARQAVAQWLIMGKSGQAWGPNAATSATVDALLGTIDVNRAVNGSATATVNGKKITGAIDSAIGLTVARLDKVKGSGITLSVTKDTGLPAMGAVITRAVMPMDSIPASTHPSVSIAKRINVVRGTGVDGVSAGLAVGDRVKVQLVIKVTDDLDYVTVVDRRAACLEPVNQLSGYTVAGGVWFYREITDSETRYYFYGLRRGTYVIDTDMNVMAQGTFTSGVATLQSQLDPSITANSSARPMTVK